MRIARRRWSNNDKVKGPFLYSRDSRGYRPFTLVLDSGDGDESPGCCLRMSAFGHTLIIDLPAIIKPWRQWVDTSKYEWSTSPKGGYWDVHSNEYGFSLSDGFLQVFLGPQTDDSDTTKDWCTHLPWTQWRHVRQSWYGPTGEHIETLWDTSDREVRRAQRDWRYEFEKTLTKNCFTFKDYDGELITAATHIEEREWRFGEGWFKWLSWFRAPRIRRSLSLEFNKEVGPEKGLWKGGTVGHSIEMIPGELHEAAFRRYCEIDHHGRGGQKTGLTFIGPSAVEWHPV